MESEGEFVDFQFQYGIETQKGLSKKNNQILFCPSIVQEKRYIKCAFCFLQTIGKSDTHFAILDIRHGRQEKNTILN